MSKIVFKLERRPPAPTRGTQVGLWLHTQHLVALDKWITSTGVTVTRTEAIRQLIEQAICEKARERA